MEKNIEFVSKADTEIKICLKNSEDSFPPSVGDCLELSPRKINKISWTDNGGTANLFVFSSQDELKWKGVIPTKVKKPIEILQNGEKVIFDNIELQKDFAVTTGFQEKSSNYNTFFWILILVLFLGILIYFIYRNKN